MESLSNMERDDRDRKRAYRLERMVELCRCFGDPQECCPVIHIAGSKGKGSTAAFTAHILGAAGKKTGLYTSPHLSDYRERIRIIEKGEEDLFSHDSLLLTWMNRIRKALDSQELAGGYPTTFELLTLLAFILFREEGCDYVVLETGLGGRLDATNVCRPAVTLITPVEKEHTALLGNTLAEIAGEKGGIIKEGVPLLLSSQNEEALTVLTHKALEKSAPLIMLGNMLKDFRVEYDPRGIMKVRFDWHKGRAWPAEVSLPLFGAVQGENAAMAIGAVKNILPDLDNHIMEQGLRKTFLPGRSQILSRKPLIMLDGSHTPRSTEAVRDAFMEITREARSRILIFGCAADKDARAMAEVLGRSFDRVIISRPGTFKESDPALVARIFGEITPCELMINPAEAAEAIRKELAEGGALLVTGSFYLAGEIRNALA